MSAQRSASPWSASCSSRRRDNLIVKPWLASSILGSSEYDQTPGLNTCCRREHAGLQARASWSLASKPASERCHLWTHAARCLVSASQGCAVLVSFIFVKRQFQHLSFFCPCTFSRPHHDGRPHLHTPRNRGPHCRWRHHCGMQQHCPASQCVATCPSRRKACNTAHGGQRCNRRAEHVGWLILSYSSLEPGLRKRPGFIGNPADTSTAQITFTRDPSEHEQVPHRIR